MVVTTIEMYKQATLDLLSNTSWYRETRNIDSDELIEALENYSDAAMPLWMEKPKLGAALLSGLQ